MKKETNIMIKKDIETLEERSCFRCGKVIKPGAVSYLVNIRVFSNFDGILLEPEQGVDKELEKLLKQLEESTPEELERDVYEEFTLILCKSCRDRFVNETRYPWEGPFKMRNDSGRIIH